MKTYNLLLTWTANKWYQPKFKGLRKLGSATPDVVPLSPPDTVALAPSTFAQLQRCRGWISRFRTLIVFRKELRRRSSRSGYPAWCNGSREKKGKNDGKKRQWFQTDNHLKLFHGHWVVTPNKRIIFFIGTYILLILLLLFIKHCNRNAICLKI